MLEWKLWKVSTKELDEGEETKGLTRQIKINCAYFSSQLRGGPDPVAPNLMKLTICCSL